MTKTVRSALIADNDVYFQMAVSALLTRELGFSEVIEAHSFDEATEYLRGHPEVSIAIMNFSTPGMSAAVGLRIIRECYPATKVAVISNSDSRRNVLSALESGVHGYVPKNVSVVTLTSALRLILDGGIYVPPSLAEVAPRLPQSVIRLAEPGASSDIAARGPVDPAPKGRSRAAGPGQAEQGDRVSSQAWRGHGQDSRRGDLAALRRQQSCGGCGRLRAPQFCAQCLPLEPQST